MDRDDLSLLDRIRTLAPKIDGPDRARYSEVCELLAHPSRLLFDAEEARRHSEQMSEARNDLLAILRRAELQHRDDPDIAALLRHYEGRDPR
jgi:hypothetical protein